MARFLFPLAILTVFLSGCGSSEFGGDAMKGILEGAPLKLEGEQVTLTQSQVDCGVQNELWDPPSDRVAHLTQKARDLHFTDDVRIDDPEIHFPYTQVTGSFPVVVADVAKIRDTNGGMKLADVKLGITVTNDCFTAPLPLMGIRKGKFTPDAPVVFRFQNNGKDWTLDKLMH
jgi:hypothetical protein